MSFETVSFWEVIRGAQIQFMNPFYSEDSNQSQIITQGLSYSICDVTIWQEYYCRYVLKRQSFIKEEILSPEEQMSVVMSRVKTMNSYLDDFKAQA